MQIIKHGKVDNYQRICIRCNCEFTYNLSDLSPLAGGDIGACPECGKEFTHKPDSPGQSLTMFGTTAPAVVEALGKGDKTIGETDEALDENSDSGEVQPIVETNLDGLVKESREGIIQDIINYPEPKPFEGKTQFSKEVREDYNNEVSEHHKSIPEWIKTTPVENFENATESLVTPYREFPTNDFVKLESDKEVNEELFESEVEPKTDDICQKNIDPFGISPNLSKLEPRPIFGPNGLNDGLDRKLPEAQGPSIPELEVKHRMAHQGPGYANSSSDIGYFGHK